MTRWNCLTVESIVRFYSVYQNLTKCLRSPHLMTEPKWLRSLLTHAIRWACFSVSYPKINKSIDIVRINMVEIKVDPFNENRRNSRSGAVGGCPGTTRLAGPSGHSTAKPRKQRKTQKLRRFWMSCYVKGTSPYTIGIRRMHLSTACSPRPIYLTECDATLIQWEQIRH